MSDAYKTKTLTQHGKTYKIEWISDDDMGAPWEECDGHGIVSDWTTRDKTPGEWVLNSSRGSKRYYDAQETQKIALRDCWGISGDASGMTKKQIAAQAVRQDFEYLRAWCNDEWHYCGIRVTLMNDDDEETEISASLWGTEDQGYLSEGYHATVIQDLIGECEYQENRATYPVTHCGV
jgi:hypothetical protein